jgi:hypothetical protein
MLLIVFGNAMFFRVVFANKLAVIEMTPSGITRLFGRGVLNPEIGSLNSGTGLVNPVTTLFTMVSANVVNGELGADGELKTPSPSIACTVNVYGVPGARFVALMTVSVIVRMKPNWSGGS